MVLMLLTLSFSVNTVNAATGDIPIENFDSYAEGVNSGSNAYVNWYGNVSTVTSTTLKHSGSLSIRQKYAPSSLYVNATDDIVFYGMSFWYHKGTATDMAALDKTISIYNDTMELFRFFIEVDDDDIEVYNFGGSSWNVLYDNGNLNQWLEIGFQDNRSVGSPINYLWAYVKNSTGSILGQSEFSWNSSEDFTNKTRYFHQFRMVNSAHTYNPSTYGYLDDIVINTESGYAGSGSCDFSGYNIFYTGNDNYYNDVSGNNKYIEIDVNGIRSWNISGFKLLVHEDQIDLGSSLSDYFLYINSIPCGSPTQLTRVIISGTTCYYILWCGLDVSLSAEKLLIEVSNSNPNSDGDYWLNMVRFANYANAIGYYHNTIASYGNGILDGSPLATDIWLASPVFWVYYLPNTDNPNNLEPFNSTMYDSYVGIYGNFFIEFNHNFNELCYYHAGDSPDLIINVTDAYFGEQDGYYIYFKYVSTNETIYIYDLNLPEDSASGYLSIEFPVFYKKGQYQMYVYNKTSIGGVKSLIYISDPITVCENDINIINNGGDLNFATIPLVYRILIALFIIIGLTLTPLALAMFLSKNGMNVKIPELVYVAFFFLGLVVSIAFGFLDVWILFVILFGLIVTLAILWIQRNGIGGGE